MYPKDIKNLKLTEVIAVTSHLLHSVFTEMSAAGIAFFPLQVLLVSPSLPGATGLPFRAALTSPLWGSVSTCLALHHTH